MRYVSPSIVPTAQLTRVAGRPVDWMMPTRTIIPKRSAIVL
jgi:hypothetical protein